jgi:hypothetical protein
MNHSNICWILASIFSLSFEVCIQSIHVTQTPFSFSQIGKIDKTAKLKKIKQSNVSFTNWLASDLHRIFRRFLRLFDHLRFQLDEQTNQKISSKMKTMRVTKISSQSKIISTILGELLSLEINFLFPCKLESNNNFVCISLTNDRSMCSQNIRSTCRSTTKAFYHRFCKYLLSVLSGFKLIYIPKLLTFVLFW